ncbi:MAG: hypothetical protein J6D25_01440, partial [Eggerthellaceae bacterium]|nr:hypothetical protein [Eggerthellaceae bacterium]
MKSIAKITVCACAFALAAVLAGCASGGAASSSAAASDQSSSAASASAPSVQAASSSASAAAALEDGVYSAKFDTDSSMFHVNEALDGRGELTVEGGKMTIHVSLVSKK